MSGSTSEAREYPHPLIRPDWLDLVREEIIEPDLPIIDPHHHLWHDRKSGRYLLEDLYGDLNSGHNIVATVFLQCAWLHRKDGPVEFRPVRETELVHAAAVLGGSGAYGKTRACAGIVAFADLTHENLDAVLDAHAVAGGGYFRGIRHITAWDDAIVANSSVIPPKGLLRDPAYLRGVRRLGERGLTFETWLYHPQLPDLLEVTRAAPETAIVIDHVGGPLGCGPYRSRRDEVFSAWRAGMKNLAACPNVHVKLGGLAMTVSGFDYHEQALPPTSARMAEDWKPYIDTCIELFGVDRCMFESNFPVDKGLCGYPVLWNAFKLLASGASAGEKAALFHDTAARFYKLAA
jgi:predicted TIM-barrel fold metal-dependent hydrolase